MPQPSDPLEEDELNGKPPQGQEERLYPDPFYCPLTQKVMQDPVVGADGDSFERSAVLERDSAGDALQQQLTHYPNRALKSLIEKEKQRMIEQGTVWGALRKAEASLRAGFQQMLDKSALPTSDYRPLPDAYYCPITMDLLSRPTIDPDGYTYERQAILGWIQTKGSSPLTRNALSAEQLRDNNALGDLIDAEVNKGEHSIHPSMRRLKESRLQAVDEESRPPNPPEVEERRRPDQPEEGNPYPTSQEEIDEATKGKCVWGTVAFLCAVIFHVGLLCLISIRPWFDLNPVMVAFFGMVMFWGCFSVGVNFLDVNNSGMG